MLGIVQNRSGFLRRRGLAPDGDADRPRKPWQEKAATALFALLLGAMVFLPNLGNPSHPFWDEYYYLPAVQRHMEGVATYAPHPPLGFMLMAGGARLADGAMAKNHALSAFGKVTDQDVPASYDYQAVRLPAAVFAVAGSVLFYLILLHLTGSAFAGLAFTTLFVFENALVVQFRSAQLDAFQITFVLAALLVWLRRPDAAKTLRDYLWFAVFLALAVAVKTNAAVLLVLPFLALIGDIRRNFRAPTCLQAALKAAAGGGAFFAVLLAVFTLNIALSPQAPDIHTEKGRNDLSYMEPHYQAYLDGRERMSVAAWTEAVTGYSAFMHDDFVGVTRTDRNGQEPWTWPFTTKTLSYRWDSDGTNTSYTLMFGNPIGWRLSLAGIVIGLGLVVLRRRQSNRFRSDNHDADFARLETLIVMYVFFLFAHTMMGSYRVMYIYHHFIALLLGFIALALDFKIAASHWPVIARHKTAVLNVICLSVAFCYLFYAPLSRHQPLTRQGCELRALSGPAFACVGKR